MMRRGKAHIAILGAGVAGLQALTRLGIESSSIEDVIERRLTFTYPIPTCRSDREEPEVIEFFESQHIYPLRRARSWSYANVDGMILQAWEKIPQILEQEGLK